jgi:hypothetical protein
MADAYINIVQQLSPSDLFYINTKKQLQADIIIAPDTIIFSEAAILQPSPLLPPTTPGSFEFYINGQNAPSLLASFNSYEGGISVSFDTAQLGFELEEDDEVIAIGKFA